jgi:hypothetical protein
MVKTASREKWTGWLLDDLNRVVGRKLRQFDGNIRLARIEINDVVDEMNQRFNRPDCSWWEISSSLPCFKRPSIETTIELTRGESWPDERIDDLRHTVSNSVAKCDGDVQKLRDEVGTLRSELPVRFVALDRDHRRRCNSHLAVPSEPHSVRTWVVSVATPPSGPWTDGRLDDFNHSTDVAFSRLECDVREIQSELKDLYEGMKDRFRARDRMVHT